MKSLVQAKWNGSSTDYHERELVLLRKDLRGRLEIMFLILDEDSKVVELVV